MRACVCVQPRSWGWRCAYREYPGGWRHRRLSRRSERDLPLPGCRGTFRVGASPGPRCSQKGRARFTVGLLRQARVAVKENRGGNWSPFDELHLLWWVRRVISCSGLALGDAGAAVPQGPGLKLVRRDLPLNAASESTFPCSSVPVGPGLNPVPWGRSLQI